MSHLLQPTHHYNKSSVSSTATRISETDFEDTAAFRSNQHRCYPGYQTNVLGKSQPRLQPGVNLLETEEFRRVQPKQKRSQRNHKQKITYSDHEDSNSELKQKFKTELCKNFDETGNCKFGSRCRFAHGAHEIQPKVYAGIQYKTKMCDKFYRQGYCPYGHRCLYKHTVSQQGNLNTFCEKLLGSLQQDPSQDLAHLINQQQSK